jgi:uncharacterized protein YdeI (YjbR/CyaY-like superfamily)
MDTTNPKVDAFISRAKQWQHEYGKMRSIALSSQLTEDMKWGCPCYTLGRRNVVLIHGFKDYCAFLFFKGALMKDPDKLLIQQTENVQSSRQIRFTSLQEIEKLEPVLKSYIVRAIEVEKLGLKVEFKKPSEYPISDEFQLALDEIPALKTAFYALTPGRQRAYLLFFAAPKQPKTREERVKKYLSHILSGKGMDD